ncbi:DMT family transporter [Actinobacillus capsulatus]|uniref:DMT family transporter n=1 Tax=Actinobacillus capsulatus TaxID=717 RepID=UPI00035F2212|nr:DMT family transporter [Actinobacillus capsulatus]
MFTSLFAIALGVMIAFQTAINVRLRQAVVSPFLASFVSLAVGAVALGVATLVQGDSLLISSEQIAASPWWSWIGGVLAMGGLTINILIFPRLGSVQTAVMPILGQVVTGVIIDTFGLFQSPQFALSWLRLAGVALVLFGIFVAIILPSLKAKSAVKNDEKSLLGWQLLGIFGGVLVGMTPAVNAALRHTLGSPLQSAFVPFFTAAVLLALFVSLTEPLAWQRLATACHNTAFWQWTGGVLGAAYVFGIILLVPLIGTGGAIIASLFGLIAGSLIIDQFGLLGATRKPINIWQILGLAILLSGIVVIQLSK